MGAPGRPGRRSGLGARVGPAHRHAVVTREMFWGIFEHAHGGGARYAASWASWGCASANRVENRKATEAPVCRCIIFNAGYFFGHSNTSPTVHRQAQIGKGLGVCQGINQRFAQLGNGLERKGLV